MLKLLIFTFSVLCTLKTANGNFPENIKLDVPYDATKTITFNLELVKQSDTEIVEGESSITVTEGKNEDPATYKDGNNRALFMVTNKEGVLSYSGTFFVRKKPHMIWRADDTTDYGYGEYLEKEWLVDIEGVQYKLSSYIYPGLDLSEDEVEAPKEKEEKKKEKKKYVFKGKQDLTIEVLLIIDYTNYKKFLSLHKSEHNAIAHIRYFYCHIMLAVNDNFQRLQHANFSLSTTTTALYIAKTPQESHFTKLKDGLTQGNPTLSAISDWAQKMKLKNTFQWPEFDVAILMNNNPAIRWVGLAFMSTICEISAVCIVQHLDSFGLVGTIAHEIGHVMGSFHDSQGNNCSAADQLLMAATSFSGTSFYHNEGNFSQCSLEYFYTRIQDLNENDRNCLLNKPADHHPLNKESNKERLLGQQYTLDQQCQLFYGDDSYFCGADSLGTQFCRHLVCFSSKYNYCLPGNSFRAFNGTSCGNHQWCQRGVCVYDVRAPAMQELDCPFGDSKAPMSVPQDEYFRCTQLGHHNKNLCYRENVAKYCCRSCKRWKDERKPNCPYGSYLREDQCRYGSCESNSFRRDCCEQCEHTDANGCSQVEMEHCSTMQAVSCYNEDVRRVCCKTCQRLKRRDPACAYGDKAPWCQKSIQEDPEFCDESTFEYCCESCRV